jgi:hypothetical protein
MDMINDFSRILLCILLFEKNGYAQQIEFYSPGPYAVGYQHWGLKDISRSSISNAKKYGRELNIAVWYPTQEKSGKKASAPDYMADTWPSAGKSIKAAFLHHLALLRADSSKADRLYTLWSQHPAKSIQNARPIGRALPLIVFPGDIALQSILAEYLASRGYIVLSPQTKGSYTHDMEYNLTGIESAVQDIQFALREVRTRFLVQPEYAFMGNGFQATNGLALACRDANLRAYISLEGGITTGFEQGLIQKNPYYQIRHIRAPMMIIHAPHPDVKPELTHQYKYADKYYQSYPESSEFYFLNFGFWDLMIPGVLPSQHRLQPAKSVQHAAQSIYQFLEAVLRKSMSIDRIQWEAPSISVSYDARLSVPIPPTIEEVMQQVDEHGMGSFLTMYKSLTERDPQVYHFTDWYTIISRYIHRAEWVKAQQLASLFGEEYPSSGIPDMLLGRTYLELKDKALAKENYTEALRKLPDDTELNPQEKETIIQQIKIRLESLE